MKLGALFSGGKDSTYALAKAMKKHYVVCLISIISKNKDSYMFHTPIDFVGLQAEAIGLPLIKKTTEGKKEEELEDLKDVIRDAKEKYEIEGVVTGAVASSYQAERIQKICDELGLECFNPLWGKDQEELMREIVDCGFKFIITRIAADGLDESWLGKEIDNEDVDKLVDLNKKIGINIAFEGGEAETLMIDGSIFKSKLVIEKAEKRMETKNIGIYKINKIYKLKK